MAENLIMWCLLAHMVSEYLIQPEWLLFRKRKTWIMTIIEAMLYTLGIWIVLGDQLAMTALPMVAVFRGFSTRARLATRLTWFRNSIALKRHRTPWLQANNTGIDHKRPYWMGHRHMMVIDAFIHSTVLWALSKLW